MRKKKKSNAALESRMFSLSFSLCISFPPSVSEWAAVRILGKPPLCLSCSKGMSVNMQHIYRITLCRSTHSVCVGGCIFYRHQDAYKLCSMRGTNIDSVMKSEWSELQNVQWEKLVTDFRLFSNSVSLLGASNGLRFLTTSYLFNTKPCFPTSFLHLARCTKNSLFNSECVSVCLLGL